jgi:hypothetical protein
LDLDGLLCHSSFDFSLKGHRVSTSKVHNCVFTRNASKFQGTPSLIGRDSTKSGIVSDRDEIEKEIERWGRRVEWVQN